MPKTDLSLFSHQETSCILASFQKENSVLNHYEGFQHTSIHFILEVTKAHISKSTLHHASSIELVGTGAGAGERGWKREWSDQWMDWREGNQTKKGSIYTKHSFMWYRGDIEYNYRYIIQLLFISKVEYLLYEHFMAAERIVWPNVNAASCSVGLSITPSVDRRAKERRANIHHRSFPLRKTHCA